MRRKFAGQARMPKIGYGSNKKTRFMLPNVKVRKAESEKPAAA